MIAPRLQDDAGMHDAAGQHDPATGWSMLHIFCMRAEVRPILYPAGAPADSVMSATYRRCTA